MSLIMVYGILYVLLPLHILTKPKSVFVFGKNKSTKKYTLNVRQWRPFFSSFFSGHILYKYMQGISKRI